MKSFRCIAIMGLVDWILAVSYGSHDSIRQSLVEQGRAPWAGGGDVLSCSGGTSLRLGMVPAMTIIQSDLQPQVEPHVSPPEREG